MRYCMCFFVLEFPNHVKGQQFNLTGSSPYAMLGTAFTWTCDMFIPSGMNVNGIKFYRNNTVCVGISSAFPGNCTIESPIPRYTYRCVSEHTFALTIPAENMTENEQKSVWRCEYVFGSSFKSPDVYLEIAIDVYNISLIPNEKSLTIREGNEQLIRCKVNSNAVPSPTFNWYLGSENITSKAGNMASSITITGNRTDNAKTLKCEAKNNEKLPKKASTTLNVEYPPEVKILPKKTQIEHTNLSINCNTTPGNPNTTKFLWTKVDSPGFMQREANLLLPHIQKNSSGTYKCKATNTYRNGDTGTHSGEIVIDIQYPPIVHTLSRQDIVVNESSTVTCNATPGNPSSTTFYWTKEDDPFFGQDGATLKLNNVQKTSFGTYICSAENIYSNEAKGRDSQSMIINVLYPPKVEALSTENVIEGNNLSKICNATPGNPNFTSFFWTKIDDTQFRQDGSILQLPNINRTSSGTYKCTAENKYSNDKKGTSSQTMVVDVLYKPVIQDKPPQFVNESETVTLTRDISSKPSSDAFWYRKMKSLKNQTSVTTASFTIERATCTATKNYTLVARNRIGNDTASVELIVNCKPKPNRYNITLGITDLTGIEFSTIVIAYPEPYYILENENGTTNNRMMASIARNAINNFTICFNQTNVQQSDYGTYFLKLTNSFGTATVPINVLPQRKPVEPRDINVECEVSGASVQWISSFNGGDPQRFIIYATGNQRTIISSGINDTGENKVHSIYVQNLQPSVLYVFYVSAQNRHGNSSSENFTCTTLKKDTGDSLPTIVGGAAAAGITLAVIVIAVVLLRRYMQIEKQTGNSQRFKNEVAENEEVNDDGMRDNILYVSAGPKVDEKAEGAVYASVNKNAPESNNNANVYAEVNKSGHKNAEGALYSDVKPKRGFFKKDGKDKKEKRQKRKQEVADVYENSDDIAMTANPDNVYSNTNHKNDSAKKEQRGYKNKDGLLYVEVKFDTKTEERNPVIHGDDEKTDYATVEFPVPSSSHDRE